MVIGIEGLVGAGKTSICRELLNIIPNAVLLHGGNLYRAIVYALLQEEKNILKLKFKLKKIDIKGLMEKYKIDIKMENNESVVYIDGIKISEEELQSKASSLAVSIVGGLADNTRLFEYAKEYIDNLKSEYNRYLESFRDFVNNVEKIEISGRVNTTVFARLQKLNREARDVPEFVKKMSIDYSNAVDEKLKELEAEAKIAREKANRAMFSSEIEEKILRREG